MSSQKMFSVDTISGIVNKPSKDPIRLGIIGVSGYAGILIDNFQRYVSDGHVRWIAACGVNKPEDIARCEVLASQGAHTYTDWRMLIDKHAGELDLLVIATAIYTHREMIEYALSHALRVFVEKPLAANFEDALAIEQAERCSKGELIVGYQNQCSEATHTIKRAILDGKLGKILSIRAIGCWPRDASYYSRNDWAGRLELNGKPVNDSPVNNALAHYINLMLFWAGAQPEQTAHVEAVEGSLYRARAIESFDTASLCIHTREGIRIEFHGTHSCLRSIDPEIEIIGSKGRVEWFFDGTAVIESTDGTHTLSHTGAIASRDIMVSTLIRWACGQRVIACTVDQALEQARVVELIHLNLPIHTIDPAYIDTVGDLPAIRGIEEVFMNRFKQGGHLLASDAPWLCQGIVENHQIPQASSPVSGRTLDTLDHPSKS